MFLIIKLLIVFIYPHHFSTDLSISQLMYWFIKWLWSPTKKKMFCSHVWCRYTFSSDSRRKAISLKCVGPSKAVLRKQPVFPKCLSGSVYGIDWLGCLDPGLLTRVLEWPPASLNIVTSWWNLLQSSICSCAPQMFKQAQSALLGLCTVKPTYWDCLSQAKHTNSFYTLN